MLPALLPVGLAGACVVLTPGSVRMVTSLRSDSSSAVDALFSVWIESDLGMDASSAVFTSDSLLNARKKN